MELIQLSEGLNKRSLVPSNINLHDVVKLKPGIDLYTSLFKYRQEHLEHFKKNNSLAGITGLKTNRLLFDFDNLDIEIARQDTLTACKRLIYDYNVPRENLQVAFSGNKGFHISIILDEFLNRQEFVNIVFGIAGDLSSFDTKINDEGRIIRLAYTKHPKSGLYKKPISTADLKNKSIEEIKSMAKEQGEINPESLDEEILKTSLTEKLKELKTKIYKKISTNEEKLIKGFNIEDIDLKSCPRWMEPPRFILSQGFFYGSDSVDLGERNTAFLILASTFKNQGFSAEHTLALLEVTAEKQALRTEEEQYGSDQLKREIINPVFSPSWRGGQFSSDEPLLVLTRKRFGIEDDIVEVSVEDIENVGDGFKIFAKNLSNNRIKVGLPSLDENLVLTTGMLCTVVSAPGGGKTALANLFAETVSKEQNHVLYFSLDLYKNLLFSRMLQRYVDYDIKEIFEQFENEQPDEHLMSAYADVLENYSNVGFSFKSSSIDDIEKEIQAYSKRKGVSPKLIIVDYLDKVRSPFTDPTQSSAHVAGRLSDIAKKYNTLVLLMAQPSKFGSSGPEQEFKSYRALKGSSSIESDSRVILGIYRVGYDPADQSRDKYSSLTILKNNTGPLMRLDYSWDGQAGTFTELTPEQRRDLKKLRDELESKSSKKDGWDL